VRRLMVATFVALVSAVGVAGDDTDVERPSTGLRCRIGPRADEADPVERHTVTTPNREGCAWQPGFTVADLDGDVDAMVVWDDGSGPALYAGGSFASANGLIVNYVARWDGTAWSPLNGPSGTGVDSSVNALAVFDDGSGPALYVGGRFETAGGVTVNRIARWDGVDWSALNGPSATGVGGWVNALAVYDDGAGSALYASGWFATAGGVTVNHVARWDGTAWSDLSGPSGTGLSGMSYALTTYDDGTGSELFAGGIYTSAGGVTVNNIARWNGSAWSALDGPSGSGTNGSVFALTAYDDGSGPALYAGGQFWQAGGLTVNSVARWDGIAWSALTGPSGTGASSWVSSLGVYDDGTGPGLYVGGDFISAGGVTANRVARWDGAAWSNLSGPSGNGANKEVNALTVFDDGTGPALHVGGDFETAGGVSANRVARWDGTSWTALNEPSGGGIGGIILALSTHDDGTGPALYAGGNFATAGGVIANRVARWNGSDWSPLSGPAGNGMDNNVNAFAVFDDGTGPALFVGGGFNTAGGVTVNKIARWDGYWSALYGPSGNGMNGWVNALAVFDDGSGAALYAGGWFTTAGGVTVDRIARWDGTGWSALTGPSGTGVSGEVNALAVFDDGSGPGLYVGGDFWDAGGVSVNKIARWDGSEWSALTGPSWAGVDDTINALAVFDDGTGTALYAGGDFWNAGGVMVDKIARWDGTEWSALSGPSGTGMDNNVYSLTASDDGSGTALYAGGPFVWAGGVMVNRIARWDGTEWSALTGPSDTGMNGYVYALTGFNAGSGPMLQAGGSFTIAGGQSSTRIAAWVCDSLAPSDPTSLASPSHTPGAWSTAGVVDVEWSGATDAGGSGLAGYSVLFDTSPATVPDDTIELAHTVDPHSTSSSLLADGTSHWFHLRTCDNVGNCTDGVNLGPFWIDATPPRGPTDLHSTSHTPGEPSCERFIDMIWTAATDGGSGLDGYAWAVTPTAGWTCDQVKDLEEGATSLTTPELGDWVWYVYLCAVDNVGNWNGVARSGPYPICPLFWDDFETGTTDAWSWVMP